VNNYKWLGKLNYINFLREIGKHFTINKMLSFESVKLRLEREQSLSYMEFNYMILQAYDFLELSKTKGCLLQIGGSDQWGNIVNGVELIKRHSNKHAFGLTTPLITLASGAKMGKTEKGAIWLDKKLLSPYDYYQFWRNTDDRDVIKFLKMFTDLEVSEIENMKNININDLKEKLALEATKMLHGEKEGNKAFETSISVFVKKEIGNQTQLPIVKIKKNEIKDGLSILDLVVRSKLLNSKGEVRRAIKDKGIKIDDDPVDNDNYLVSLEIFKDLDLIKLSHGKKNHVIIKLTN
jgi:tyrosyl-tRNA synthetase